MNQIDQTIIDSDFEKFIHELDFQDLAIDTMSVRHLYKRAWDAAIERQRSSVEAVAWRWGKGDTWLLTDQKPVSHDGSVEIQPLFIAPQQSPIPQGEPDGYSYEYAEKGMPQDSDEWYSGTVIGAYPNDVQGIHEFRNIRPLYYAAPSAPIEAQLSDDIENLVTLDKRDLFGYVRSAIKDALDNDFFEGTEANLWSDAHDRADKCLEKIIPSTQAIKEKHQCDDEDNTQWRLLPDKDSGSTGEARFECIVCGKQMFRGGWSSSEWLDKGEAKLHSELDPSTQAPDKEE